MCIRDSPPFLPLPPCPGNHPAGARDLPRKIEGMDKDELVTRLALAAGKGDKAALTEFIKLTQKDVWRLLAHLSSPEEADDLTQETYLRVISALPRFQGRSTAKTWLITLARRVWIDQIRREQSRPKKSVTEYEDVQHSTPPEWSELVDVRSVSYTHLTLPTILLV